MKTLSPKKSFRRVSLLRASESSMKKLTNKDLCKIYKKSCKNPIKRQIFRAIFPLRKISVLFFNVFVEKSVAFVVKIYNKPCKMPQKELFRQISLPDGKRQVLTKYGKNGILLKVLLCFNDLKQGEQKAIK